MKTIYKALKNTILFITIIILITGCQNNNNEPHVYAGSYFDTVITITIYDKCPDNIDDCLSSFLTGYDLMFSTDNENSTIYKINHKNGASVSCNEEFLSFMQEAIDYAKLTDGLLDPTMETVSSLYDFNDALSIPPSEFELSTAIKNVNYKNILISDNNISIPQETSINLGYVAKGYIADKLKDYIKSLGINNALINLGGNILVMGTKYGEPFNIGIKKPFTDGDTAYAVSVTDTSVVTSGIYERYFEYNNQIYHHILDNKTGLPIKNNVYSVTIVGDSSKLCDLYSTYLLILGKEKGLSFIEDRPGYEALYILDDYSIVTSSGFPNDVMR